MDNYDEDSLKETQRKIEELRSRALEKARLSCPQAEFYVDRRPENEYYEEHPDYPGRLYVWFRLPEGFASEEELVDAIARDTVEYYTGKQKPSWGRLFGKDGKV